MRWRARLIRASLALSVTAAVAVVAVASIWRTHPVLYGHGSRSLAAEVLLVRIARIGRCSDLRDIVLEVLPGGGLKLNGENQRREDLGPRLEDIFRSRYYRYVFVRGGPNVSFGEVAEVIEIAARQVDYVAIVTPSVTRQATYQGNGCLPELDPGGGTCLDPNLPSDYHGHPARQ